MHVTFKRVRTKGVKETLVAIRKGTDLVGIILTNITGGVVNNYSINFVKRVTTKGTIIWSKVPKKFGTEDEAIHHAAEMLSV